MRALGPHARALAVGLALFALSACGTSRRVGPRPVPVPSGVVGACADPGRDGALSAAPRLERHDRDLDGDARPEIVVADRALCTADGNCYWNVFSTRPGDECARFLGTLAGAALETLSDVGDHGFRSVRAWWRLAGGGRLLMEEYRFRRGGYRVVDSLLCRRLEGDRIQCAPPLRHRSAGLR